MGLYNSREDVNSKYCHYYTEAAQNAQNVFNLLLIKVVSETFYQISVQRNNILRGCSHPGKQIEFRGQVSDVFLDNVMTENSIPNGLFYAMSGRVLGRVR